MKMMMKKILAITLPIVLLGVVVLSCKDEEDELALSRMFKPAEFELTSGETSATVAWTRALFTVPGEVEYKIELSKSPAFGTVEVSETTTDISKTFLDTDIDIRVDYYARVKAIGMNGAGDSNWLVSEAFRITGEIFILPIAESDVVVDQAWIKWQADKDIHSIVLTPTSGNPIEVDVSEAEAADGKKLVDGLTPGTTYTAEIFAGDGVSKGFVRFTTKPSYADANVIDLRSITGRPGVLADTLSQIPSGSVVLLKRGATYTISSAFALDRSVTIVSGADFNPELARVFMSNNFNLVPGSAIDSLIFRDLYMYSDNYDSKYVINIGQVGTIGKVRFDNVRGHKFRGFFRLQTGGEGTKVTDLIINNCVIDSLRDFSLVNTNNSNTVANIRVTNSTIFNARKVIDHRSPGSNSIVFENCTFNNLPTGGASGGGSFWFIDLGSQNSANPIVISNCIFGKTRDEDQGGVDANGIRAGDATTVNTTNSYSTSDFISTNESYRIQGLLQYSGSSTSLFVDPANGNFTLKDNAFPGRTSAGDPRWR